MHMYTPTTNNLPKLANLWMSELINYIYFFILKVTSDINGGKYKVCDHIPLTLNEAIVE